MLVGCLSYMIYETIMCAFSTRGFSALSKNALWYSPAYVLSVLLEGGEIGYVHVKI